MLDALAEEKKYPSIVEGGFFTGFGSLGGGRGGRSLDSVLCLLMGRSAAVAGFGVLFRLLYVLVMRLLAPWMAVLAAKVVLGVASISSGFHCLGLCLISSCGFLLYSGLVRRF